MISVLELTKTKCIGGVCHVPIVGYSFARSSLESSVPNEFTVMLNARRSASNCKILFMTFDEEVPSGGDADGGTLGWGRGGTPPDPRVN